MEYTACIALPFIVETCIKQHSPLGLYDKTCVLYVDMNAYEEVYAAEDSNKFKKNILLKIFISLKIEFVVYPNL